MCHDCIVKNGNSIKRASSQYELSEILGISVQNLPLFHGYPETSLRGSDCLCPIDIERLGKNLGFKTTAPYNDPEQMSDDWIMEHH